VSAPAARRPFREAVARRRPAPGARRAPVGGGGPPRDLGGPGGAGRWTRRRWALVGGPTVLAFILAVVDLDARSLWLDEAATVSIAAQRGAGLGSAMARDGGNMLGYYALIHVLTGWFGSSVFVLRFPSVIGCAATTALVVVLADRLFGEKVALVAGAFSAVSLPSVYWAPVLRSCALMMAFVAASFLAFVALTDPRGGRAPWGAGLAYVVTTTLALYMSFVAVLVIPAQLVALVGHRRRVRPAAALGLVVVACAPLAWLARSRGSGQLFWVPRPDLAALGQVLVSLSSAGFQPNFHLTATAVPLAVVTVAAFAAALGFVVVHVARDRSAARVWGELVVVGWLVIPLVVSLVESRISQPTFTARNLLVSLPAAAIVLARVVCDRRVGRLAAAGLIVGFAGLRAAQLVPSYGVSPENWRAATLDVLQHAEPGDCVAFYPSDGKMAFTYYLDHFPTITPYVPRPVVPATPLGRVLPYVERYTTLDQAQIDRIAATCPRLWLVASHEGSPTGTAASRTNYVQYLRLAGAFETRYPETTDHTRGWASPITIWLFGKPAPIRTTTASGT
jgi:mannosyltransferase